MAKRSKRKGKSVQAPRTTPISRKKTLPLIWAATHKWQLLQALVIALVGLWIYWPALHGGWLWDDDVYITDNVLLHDPSRLWKIWFLPGRQLDYYPVLQTIQLIQWNLWHNDTLGYHLTNLVLHLTNALLVWKLLSQFDLKLAWVGGLLFAMHPVQVESVAWIAELKNTLSLPFLLLAMCFYLDYEEHKRRSDYLLALGLFGVALLCKISVVMFPVVILLFTWWKRKRIGWSDLKVSAPFFMISLAAGSITVLSGIWDQQFNHLSADKLPTGGLLARLVLAGTEIAFYFSKSILPLELLPVYPKWSVDLTPLHYLPWLVLVAVIYYLWTKRQSWGRHALLGLGFFLLNLLPCPGFIPAPNMGYAWVMDHFLYLPIIGLIGLVVAIMGQVTERLAPFMRQAGMAATAAILALLAYESHSYAKLYVNPETYWTYTVQHNPQAYTAYDSLGNAREQEGRISEAIEYFEKALRIKPDYAMSHNNLGDIQQEMGRLPEAILQYQQALQIRPNYAEAHNNLGLALFRTGQTPEAIEQYQKALEIKPDNSAAHYNLGNALLQAGQVVEAIKQYNQALQLKPDYVEAHTNLGAVLLQESHVAEAIQQFEQALQINPDYGPAQNDLAIAQALQQAASVKK